MTIDRTRGQERLTTILYGVRPAYRTAATPAGDDFWLPAGELPAATGWELKPEGLCQTDVCIRIPQGIGLVDDTQLNLAALARLLDQPVVRDDAHGVWCAGEASPARRAALQSLEAPDFTLPDLDGRSHRLSDYRGRKIFLVSWASW